MADIAEWTELELPDFEDTEAVCRFMTVLEYQSTRHGVKKLLGHCEQILGYKEKIAQNIEQAEQTLIVVNGKRTPLQAAKDRARGYRNTAEKFYEGLDWSDLVAMCGVYGITPDTREQAVAQLVECYVLSRERA